MFKVSLKGLNGVKAQFNSATKDVKRVVRGELHSASADFVAGARRDAPEDQRALVGAITWSEDSELSTNIVAQKFYAPFMEFGTKGKYKPIPGTEEIAAAFKGYKGGDFQELLRMIVRWVKRKGIAGRYSVKTRRRVGGKAAQQSEDLSAAWPIAMSILKNGVTPHPYFFKQMDVVWPRLVENTRRKLQSETRISVTMPGGIKRPKVVTV